MPTFIAEENWDCTFNVPFHFTLQFLIWGGFHKAIYIPHLKFALCVYPFCTNLLSFGIMHLRLALNLLHFLPDLSAFRALGCALNFYEPHPWSQMFEYWLWPLIWININRDCSINKVCELLNIYYGFGLPHTWTWLVANCTKWNILVEFDLKKIGDLKLTKYS
jgi:hypothetical protein